MYRSIMKITLSIPALATILALALAGAPVTAQAQTSTNSPAATAPADAAPTTPKPAKTPYAGTITAIDGKSVTVTTDSGALTLAITPTTKIAKDKGVHGKVSDFAVGDKVTGHYTTDAAGAISATTLYKKAPKPAAAPAAQ